MTHIFIQIHTRINRYIVGCKLEHINKALFIKVRINRYIVGCKLGSAPSVYRVCA